MAHVIFETTMKLLKGGGTLLFLSAAGALIISLLKIRFQKIKNFCDEVPEDERI